MNQNMGMIGLGYAGLIFGFVSMINKINVYGYRS